LRLDPPFRLRALAPRGDPLIWIKSTVDSRPKIQSKAGHAATSCSGSIPRHLEAMLAEALQHGSPRSLPTVPFD
jgi:hypothetical protein